VLLKFSLYIILLKCVDIRTGFYGTSSRGLILYHCLSGYNLILVIPFEVY